MSDFEKNLNNLLSNPDALNQIFQLAQSLEQNTPTPVQPPQPPPVQQNTIPQAQSLFAGIDTASLMKLLPLIQEAGEKNVHVQNFLFAIRPYLKPDRQKKVEQALQLSHMIYLGKKYLMNREDE